MARMLDWLGNLAGAAGVLICLLAGIARLAGYFHVAGYEALTLFIAGTGVMVFACLVKLQLLIATAGPPR